MSHLSLILILLAECLLALSSLAFATEQGLPAQDEPLSLYFNDSELVEVATRAPTPLIQVAENVTLVTAYEIEAMHAQSLSEVLTKLAGLHLRLMPPDFNGATAVYIEGSREEHVLVLIDGVRLNSIVSGSAELSSIPLRIIKRIEIIKGPSSSVWGSSQGGVINIITKDPGTTTKPSGSVAGDFGEREVAAYEADLTGKVDRLGYYLYAGRQDSNGLINDRYYDSDRAYGKLSLQLPDRLGRLTVTGSTSAPHMRVGSFYLYLDDTLPYYSQDLQERTHFITANYDTSIGNAFHLNIAARHYEGDIIQHNEILAGSPMGDPGSLLYAPAYNEKSQGMNFLLTWSGSMQTVTLGGEINRSQMTSTTEYGPWSQAALGLPAKVESNPGYEEVWGIFANDTLRFGRLTVTPGIRYDHHSISASIVSPSLGATYRLSPETLLRAVVSRGFQFPTLSYIAGGGIYDNPNKDLKPEKVTSFQLGVETEATSYLYLKLSGFYHNISDTWRWDDRDVPDNQYKNSGNSHRQGIEAEVKTVAWHSLSLVANSTYIQERYSPPGYGSVKDSSTAANLILRYRDPAGWYAELAGHYIWWFSSRSSQQREDPIWSLCLGRTIYKAGGLASADLYLKVNNLFSGTSIYLPGYPLPQRWLLAGIRLNF